MFNLISHGFLRRIRAYAASVSRALCLRYPPYARWKRQREERAVRRRAEQSLRTAWGLTYARDREARRAEVVILVRNAEFALFSDGEPVSPEMAAVKPRVQGVCRELDAGTMLSSGKIRDELRAILEALARNA